MAGRLPPSALKRLLPPETHGVTPLADAARRHVVSCGKRRAALPAPTRGLATAYAIDVRRTERSALDYCHENARDPPFGRDRIKDRGCGARTRCFRRRTRSREPGGKASPQHRSRRCNQICSVEECGPLRASLVVQYLTKAEIVDIHRRILLQSGGAAAVRDDGALESSLAQPFQTYGGDDLYPSFVSKVAALAYFIIRNHPFVDGNKRIGHAALEVTLALNQLELTAPVDDQESTILGIADGSLGREEFTQWVNRHLDRLRNNETLVALDAIKDFPHIRARMTRTRATHIRHMRVDESYSWRVIAAECHEEWAGDAAWEPNSNVLAGMELCEAAAEYFDEHFLQSPWN